MHACFWENTNAWTTPKEQTETRDQLQTTMAIAVDLTLIDPKKHGVNYGARSTSSLSTENSWTQPVV